MEIDYILQRRIFNSKKSAHKKILTEWKTALREKNIHLNHSHKKRIDSLETWAKLAVLCVYVENQAILQP